MSFLNRPKTRLGRVTEAIPLNLRPHKTKKPTGIALDSQELLKALQFVSPCISKEHARPVLECVLFDSGNGIIKLVAADGYRLATAKIKAKRIHTDKVLIGISDIAKLTTYLKAIKPIGRGKAKVYPTIYLHYDYKTVKFSTESGTIEFNKQLGNFPNYQQLIPEDGTKIQFIASSMLTATKALSHIANDGSGIIRLLFEHNIPVGKITLSSQSIELGISTAECDAIVQSDAKIAVNAKYLTDLLRLCADSKITMRVTTTSSPMVFDIDKAKQSVIMPMYVQWA